MNKLPAGEREGLASQSPVAKVLVVAACCFLAGQAGLLLGFDKTSGLSMWPAAGVALGALLRLGGRYWPGVFLGAGAANVMVFWQHPAATPWLVSAVSAGIAAGSTLEAVAGAWGLRRWLDGRNPLRRAEDVFRFGVVALGASLAGAINGSLLIRASGLVSWEHWPLAILTWWLGDFTAMLAATPLAILWRERLRWTWTPARAGEAALAALALAGLGGVIFNLWGPNVDWSQWKYFVLAPLLWVALRFNRREAALAFFLLAAIAMWGTGRERGAFEELPLTSKSLSLQCFISFTGLVILAIAAAVAERKEAAESVGLVVEAAPNGMVMVDQAGRITLANAQMEQLFGYTREELAGRSIELLLPERYRGEHPGLRRGFVAAPQARPMGHGRDLFARRKDGSEFPVEIGLNPTQTPEGWFVLASVIDITERKRAEQALRASEERFRVIAETVPSLLFTATPEGACDYASKSYQEYIGANGEALLGLGWVEVLHAEDVEPIREQWLHCVRTGEQFRAEFRVRRHDGEYRWFLGEAHPVHDEAGRIEKWFGAATDIQEQKQVRSELEATVAEHTAALQSSLNSMEELLYTIAHDLRAPNRAMQGFAQILKLEYGGQLDDTARDYLDRISAAAKRNDELICDLLALGRISHEAVPLAPVDTREAVAAVLQVMELEIQRRRARIHLGAEWPGVLANEPMLMQALTHLITNALNYVPPEKEPEISISAEQENGKTILRVHDNGIGIAADQQEKVFMPFMRLPNGLQTTGTGMGLAIVRKAVQRMRGSVGVESTPGLGSCFWMELPAA